MRIVIGANVEPPMNDLAAEVALTRHQREAVAAPRFYDPVDLVLLFRTPDDIDRTRHMGVYQTVADAQEAAGVTVWFKLANDRWLSRCGMWRIQPVSV